MMMSSRTIWKLPRTSRRRCPPRFLTARLDASNSYLRYKAEAEEALRSCGVPAVIFRCDHIYGPPSQPGPTASAFVAKSGRVVVLGRGTQKLAPLYRDDVVEAILH